MNSRLMEKKKQRSPQKVSLKGYHDLVSTVRVLEVAREAEWIGGSFEQTPRAAKSTPELALLSWDVQESSS